MDIQHSALIALHQVVSKNAHESGQDDQIGPVVVNPPAQGLIEITSPAVITVVNDHVLNPGLGGSFKPTSTGLVADNPHHPGGNFSIFAPVDDGLQICAAAAN